MKKLIGLLFVAAMPLTQLLAIDNYSVGDKLNVLAVSGLNLRDKPDGETILALLAYGSKVTISQQKLRTQEHFVDGISGHWVKVSAGKKQGWVFDGYLSAFKAPTADMAELGQYAKANFVAVTKPHIAGVYVFEGVSDVESTVTIYKAGTRKVVFTNATYYSGYSQRLAIEGLSLEEGWLIASAMFKKKVEDTRKHIQENPDVKNSYGEDYDIATYGTFEPLMNGYFHIEFYSPEVGYESLTITYDDKSKTGVIQIGGGE